MCHLTSVLCDARRTRVAVPVGDRVCTRLVGTRVDTCLVQTLMMTCPPGESSARLSNEQPPLQHDDLPETITSQQAEGVMANVHDYSEAVSDYAASEAKRAAAQAAMAEAAAVLATADAEVAAASARVAEISAAFDSAYRASHLSEKPASPTPPQSSQHHPPPQDQQGMPHAGNAVPVMPSSYMAQNTRGASKSGDASSSSRALSTALEASRIFA